MTDQELDEILDRNKPQIREALRALLVDRVAPGLMIQNVALMPFPNGQAWRLDLFIALEPMSTLMHGVMVSYPHAVMSMMKPGQPPQQSQKAPEPGKTSRLGVPTT